MLSTNKMVFDSKFAMTPTINWLDPLSWHNWLKMRNVCMDFGLKYYIRIMVYNSTFLGFYSFIMAILFLRFLDLIAIPIPIMVTAFTLYDLLFVGVILFIMLFQGARINRLLMHQRTKILEIRTDLVYCKSNLTNLLNPNFMSFGGNIKVIRALLIAEAQN